MKWVGYALGVAVGGVVLLMVIGALVPDSYIERAQRMEAIRDACDDLVEKASNSLERRQIRAKCDKNIRSVR